MVFSSNVPDTFWYGVIYFDQQFILVLQLTKCYSEDTTLECTIQNKYNKEWGKWEMEDTEKTKFKAVPIFYAVMPLKEQLLSACLWNNIHKHLAFLSFCPLAPN